MRSPPKRRKAFPSTACIRKPIWKRRGRCDAGQRPTRVIGLRSVGAPLAAVVAAGLGVRSAVTLRPTGHPFYREVRIGGTSWPAKSWPTGTPASPSWTKAPACPAVRSARSRTFWRMAAFRPTASTSSPAIWGMPGGCSSDRHRLRWQHASRHVVDIGDMLIHKPRRPEHRLETWATELVGPPAGELKEISGGGLAGDPLCPRVRVARREGPTGAPQVPAPRRWRHVAAEVRGLGKHGGS